MIGKRFGKWLVIERQGSDKYRSAMYLCLCECGIGRRVISSSLRNGKSKGCGCGRVGLKRSDNGHWKGGRYINDAGYPVIYNPEHKRSMANGYVREHIFIAENVLGKSLPKKSQVHHYKEKSDPRKIVICENQQYHFLLHMREKALRGSGNPNLRKCKFCKQYDLPENLHITPNSKYGCNIHHQSCESKYEKTRRANQ